MYEKARDSAVLKYQANEYADIKKQSPITLNTNNIVAVLENSTKPVLQYKPAVQMTP
jgi:hypothetical protein